MARKPNPNRDVIIELVREEIEKCKEGKLERLTTWQELADLAEVSLRSIAKYLNLLEKSEREYITEKYAKANGQRMAALFKNPEYLRKHQEVSRIRMKALHSNPEFAEKNRVRSSKQMKALNSDPQFAEESRKRFIDLNSDPEFVEANRQRMAARYKDPEYLKKHKERSRTQMKALNADPQFSEKSRANSSERMKALHSDPEFAKAHRERSKQNGIKHIEDLRKNAYYVEERFYTSSQQEGAVALLLERYLPKVFGKVNDGINFQVRNKGINNGGIDFLVDDKFLEWHPVVLYSAKTKGGDIPSKEEKDSYRRVRESLPEDDRTEFDNEYKKVLGINYRNKRQNAVDNSEYSGKIVYLAGNLGELYNFISRQSDSLPEFADFKREFNQAVRYVKEFKVGKNKNPDMVEAA